MITITVSLPNTEKEQIKLIETLTAEKGYKLIKVDKLNNCIIFEPNRDSDWSESKDSSNKPTLLLD